MAPSARDAPNPPNGHPPAAAPGDGESLIARVARKRHAVFTPSGTAALEAALLAAGVGAGDDVVVPEECCPAVPGSVLRVNARPVLAPLDDRLVLTAEAVRATLTGRTRTVIAVHQWGSYARCAALREQLPAGVTLVEDAAQYWHPELSDPLRGGARGDLVVLSFGTDKPLTLGWGGAYCGDGTAVRTVVGLDEPDLRQRRRPVAPLRVPAPPLPALRAAMAAADATFDQRAAVATTVREALADSAVRMIGTTADTNCWHRLVLLLPGGADPAAALTSAEEHGLVVRPPYPVPLADSQLLRGRVVPAPESPFQALRGRLLMLWPPLEPGGPRRAAAWARSVAAAADRGTG